MIFVAIGIAIVAALFGGYRFWANRPLTLPVVAVEKNVPVRVFGSGELVHAMDWYATLASFAGVAVPEGIAM